MASEEELNRQDQLNEKLKQQVGINEDIFALNQNIGNDILNQIKGLENSQYAIDSAMVNVKQDIKKCENYLKLEYENNYFDFVIALGVVYTHNLTDAIKCLKQMQRVSKYL